jgi:hypothetical protein
MDEIDPNGTDGGLPAGEVQGGGVPAWTAQLSDDLKGNEAFTGYKTISDLAKDHLSLKGKATELEGKLTSDYIPKLTENATDEQKAAYRAALGVPDTPDGYEVDLPDGDDGSLSKWFKSQAHELGMPKEMAKGLSTQWNTMIGEMVKVEQQRLQKVHDESLSALEREWGANAPANKEAIKKAYQEFGGEELTQTMATEVTIGEKKIRIGDHPAFARTFLKIGKLMSPDSVSTGGQSPVISTNPRDFYNDPVKT